MEHWGHNPTVVAGSIHTPYSHGDTWTTGHLNVSSYNEFHIYSINWTSEKIQFFIDDNFIIPIIHRQKILKIGHLMNLNFLY